MHNAVLAMDKRSVRFAFLFYQTTVRQFYPVLQFLFKFLTAHSIFNNGCKGTKTFAYMQI